MRQNFKNIKENFSHDIRFEFSYFIFKFLRVKKLKLNFFKFFLKIMKTKRKSKLIQFLNG